jgi:hypothetical protein
MRTVLDDMRDDIDQFVADYELMLRHEVTTPRKLKERLRLMGISHSQIDRCTTRDDLLQLLLSGALPPPWWSNWQGLVVSVAAVVMVCMLIEYMLGLGLGLGLYVV